MTTPRYAPQPADQAPPVPGPSRPRNRRPLWRRKRWLILLAAVVGVGAALSSAPDQPTPTAGATSSTRTTVAGVAAATSAKAATVVAVTSEDLIGDFDRNQVAAEKKWHGRTVLVTGTVINVADDIVGHRYIALGSPQFTFSSVKCVLTNGDDALKVNNKETHTIRGVIGDETIGVIDVKECQVVR